MKRTQFYFYSEDDVKINAYCWEPEEKMELRGVIQIAHGMAEHILRYEDFCAFMVDNGFIVYGNDHRGHGNSIIAPDDKGFFAESNGFERVVSDMNQLSATIKKDYPHLPLIILGHSMGSFLTRRYVQVYPNDVNGIILSGIGGDKGMLGKIGLRLAKWDRRRKGPRTPSPLMDKLTFGNYNKKFAPARTKFDFLSRDHAVVDEYIADDKCGFVCTTGLFIDLISGMETIHRNSEVKKTPSDLPIFLIAGNMDPVGDDGKGVQEVYDQYIQHGIDNISFKLYENARHEVLNEVNKEEVYQDILRWIKAIVKGDK